MGNSEELQRELDAFVLADQIHSEFISISTILSHTGLFPRESHTKLNVTTDDFDYVISELDNAKAEFVRGRELAELLKFHPAYEDVRHSAEQNGGIDRHLVGNFILGLKDGSRKVDDTHDLQTPLGNIGIAEEVSRILARLHAVRVIDCAEREGILKTSVSRADGDIDDQQNWIVETARALAARSNGSQILVDVNGEYSENETNWQSGAWDAYMEEVDSAYFDQFRPSNRSPEVDGLSL